MENPLIKKDGLINLKYENIRGWQNNKICEATLQSECIMPISSNDKSPLLFYRNMKTSDER